MSYATNVGRNITILNNINEKTHNSQLKLEEIKNIVRKIENKTIRTLTPTEIYLIKKDIPIYEKDIETIIF